MEERSIILGSSIWPDVDGPEGVNQFLKGLGIKINFLLDSGLQFIYSPESLEPYQIGKGTLFFKDPKTKLNLFHYYEGFGELVFENLSTNESYKIPIYDEADFELAGD